MISIINERVIPGYTINRKQTGVFFNIYFSKINTKKYYLILKKISSNISDYENFSKIPAKKNTHRLVVKFLEVLYNIYKNDGYPIENKYYIYNKNETIGKSTFSCILNTFFPKGLLSLSFWLSDFLEKTKVYSLKDFDKYKKDVLINIAKQNKISRMNKIFLNIALKNDIPIIKISDKIIQYGFGKYGFHLNGTFSEKTSRNAVALVRNKLIASQILKRCGFPVIEEKKIIQKVDLDEFVKKIGYPVVLKPYDKDGGVDVYPNIKNKNELMKAYEKCKKNNQNIMIQKYIVGRDHRINVVNNKVVWCYERKNAAITGDGLRKIKTLIKKENLSKKRTITWENGFKPLKVTEETLTLLKSKGYNLESIPKKNEVVHLHETANISNGGLPLAIMKKNIHPDNILLAERISSAFRLDIAGIDIITKDIKKSWIENDDKIIEVNAAPDLTHTGRKVFETILSNSISGNGRVPIAIIITATPHEFKISKLIYHYINNGKKVGIVTNNAVFINHQKIQENKKIIYNQIQSTILDKNIDYLIIITGCNQDLIKFGFPIDRFDCLCVDTKVTSSQNKILNRLINYSLFDIAINKKLKITNFLETTKKVKIYEDLNLFLIDNMKNYNDYHRNKKIEISA